MKWMPHQYHARAGKPLMITVNNSGRILFNVKSVRQAIKKAKFVEIFFGMESEKDGICSVGFKFLEEKTNASSALRFYGKTRNGNFSQAVCSFGYSLAQKIGTKENLSIQVPLEFDSAESIWYSDFRKGKFVNTEAYSEGRRKSKNL